MITTVSQTVSVNVSDAPCCGSWVALTKEQEALRRQNGKTFYCSNGHPLSYSGVLTQIKAERDKAFTEVRDLRTQAQALRAANDDLLTEVNRQKKQVANIKRRAAAGVCPECHRTFSQVARHMQTKHR